MRSSPVLGQPLIVQIALDAKARQSAGAGISKAQQAKLWSEAAPRSLPVNLISGSRPNEATNTLIDLKQRTKVRAKPSPVRDPRVIDHVMFTKPRPTSVSPPQVCHGPRVKPTVCPEPRVPSSPPTPTPPIAPAPVPESPAVPELGNPPEPPVVEAPVAPPPIAPPDAGPTVIDHSIVLDNAMNQTIADLSLDGQDFGVVVGNGQHSENIILNNITATNCTDYGMYLGDVSNWTISNSTFHQAAGANQHGMRIGYGQNITIADTTVDSSLAGKSSLWLVDVEGTNITNSTFNGGAIRFGAPPNDGLGEPTARDISITNSTINKVSGGDLEAILAWPGSHNIHLSDLDITLETSVHWLAIDSRNTSNITWSNIRVNGQLVNGFEGVGTNEPIEDLLMRGIGPVAQCV